MNLVLLERLTSANSVSGDESEVRELIKSLLPAECDTKTDNIGNLIVTRKGKKTPKNKVMLAAHMDEVGFIVTAVTEEGLLKFSTVGGINPSAVFGRRVKFRNGTVGVIAAKAVHMLKGDEKDSQPAIDELTIDIGVKSREEAEKLIALGDNYYFENDFFLFGDNRLHAGLVQRYYSLPGPWHHLAPVEYGAIQVKGGQPYPFLLKGHWLIPRQSRFL